MKNLEQFKSEYIKKKLSTTNLVEYDFIETIVRMVSKVEDPQIKFVLGSRVFILTTFFDVIIWVGDLKNTYDMKLRCHSWREELTGRSKGSILHVIQTNLDKL
jgi:hypothetical protein